MRIQSLLIAVALWATTVFAVEIVSPVPENEESLDSHAEDPVLAITASFPESNPFGHVVNGEINKLFLNIENKNREECNPTLRSRGVSRPCHRTTNQGCEQRDIWRQVA